MRRLIYLTTMLYSFTAEAAIDAYAEKCSKWIGFMQPVCQRLKQIWYEGRDELYFSGYAWHNRYTYRAEKIKTYNERAWGGGLGKGLFDEKGNWHGLYSIAFLDSHSHIEPAVGYAYLKVANLSKDFKAGLGYSVLVTSRVDYFNGFPFPGALPWVSLYYKNTTLAATYIPGSAGAGNVLYILGKITL
ncbi:lipid IV(A) palmitoyltransferase PagP [Legionella waltersii]|nr:lipid IV(A) palmitoyltransferase PagP [Legionella waltersii]